MQHLILLLFFIYLFIVIIVLLYFNVAVIVISCFFLNHLIIDNLVMINMDERIKYLLIKYIIL